jgi:hypothetical protein
VVELFCHRVRFGSPGDEAAFFSWVEGIAGAGKVVGVNDGIRLEVPRMLSDDVLRELIALFQRYNIDMVQLAQFASESNAGWFAATNVYWHDRVFRKTGSAEPAVAH